MAQIPRSWHPYFITLSDLIVCFLLRIYIFSNYDLHEVVSNSQILLHSVLSVRIMSLRTQNLRRLKLVVAMHMDLLSHIQHTCESVGAAEDLLAQI